MIYILYRNKINRFIKLFGDVSSIERYPILNHIIVFYIGVTIVCNVLFLIYPFVFVVAGTPVYHVKTYLGIAGALLLALDVFTNKVVWRGPHCVFLYALSIVSVFASIRTLSYGIKDNLFLICWITIQFSLFYSCGYRLNLSKHSRLLKTFFALIVAVWFIACAISIYQFCMQIGYLQIVDPASDDLSYARQGFISGRLFGIFVPLNHAAHVSTILIARTPIAV